MEKFLQSLIKEAGEILKKGFQKELFKIGQRITSKEAAHKYDKIIDQFLIKKILQKYPDHNILTEESVLLVKNPKSKYLWVIDSLDGTGNFANSNPLFSICIAIFIENKPYLSAVYVPMTNELFFAKIGRGAYLNNRKIQVSQIKTISQSYGVYCEGNLQNHSKFLSTLQKIYPKVKDLRKLGSAGIETCWVACGMADFYFTTQIDPWDIAAGFIILLEAGGRVTDFSGKPWQLKRDNYFFSNKILHKKLLNLISESE